MDLLDLSLVHPASGLIEASGLLAACSQVTLGAQGQWAREGPTRQDRLCQSNMDEEAALCAE